MSHQHNLHYGELKRLMGIIHQSGASRDLSTAHIEFLLYSKLVDEEHIAALKAYIDGHLMGSAHMTYNAILSQGGPQATIMHDLQYLIQHAPPVPKNTPCVRAHIFGPPRGVGTEIPDVGEMFKFDKPTSTSMFYPLAFEWTFGRHENDERMYNQRAVLVIALPQGFNNALAVGCPSPINRCKAHNVLVNQRFPVEGQDEKDDMKRLLKGQAEIILGANTILKVKQKGRIMANRISNNNKDHPYHAAAIAGKTRWSQGDSVPILWCDVVEPSLNTNVEKVRKRKQYYKQLQNWRLRNPGVPGPGPEKNIYNSAIAKATMHNHIKKLRYWDPRFGDIPPVYRPFTNNSGLRNWNKLNKMTSEFLRRMIGWSPTALDGEENRGTNDIIKNMKTIAQQLNKFQKQYDNLVIGLTDDEYT